MLRGFKKRKKKQRRNRRILFNPLVHIVYNIGHQEQEQRRKKKEQKCNKWLTFLIRKSQYHIHEDSYVYTIFASIHNDLE